ERMARLGMVQHAIDYRYNGLSHRIDFTEATGGRIAMVYPQQEVTKDAGDARQAAGGQVLYESPVVAIDGIDGPRPVIRFESKGEPGTLQCDFVAGCDGFHGLSRQAMPPGVLKAFDRIYPFGWLGIL